MNRRISQSITPNSGDIAALRAPFISKGANDPVIAELRRQLKDAVPAWVHKLNEGQELTAARLEEVQSAVDTYRRLIEFLLPEGKVRSEALSVLDKTESVAAEMTTELSGAGAFG
ncbi:hypothetical protein [Nocardia pseudovaccinii]|uniref:hypothetical protein n=1 Tax=Nocardia pseudovaccinii TaxID=189540 RepID=UPI0007A548BD|nr:hypothetical protein [Nocardia pseudovaccinii]